MDNNPGFLMQVQLKYNQLTKVERKVADYVINNPESTLYMSITDLADECGVGEASVYRFCKDLNLQGYQEFKMQLSLSLAAQGINSENQSEPSNLAEKIMQHEVQAIQDTLGLLNHEHLNQVIEIMHAARKIYFFGIGDSHLSAMEGKNKFLRITGKVDCIADPHLQTIAASIASPEDLIIIISYSGATKDNIYVAKEAKKAGTKIVCITHYQKSPLTAYADIILLSGGKESPMEGGSIAARMGQLYLIDVLYQEYYYRNVAESTVIHEKSVRSVVDKLL